MEISRARIARVANISDDVPLLNKLPDYQTVGVALQVGVIENELSVAAELIDRCAAAFTRKELYDLAIGRGQDWSSGRRWNIDGIMDPPLRARVREGVHQLIRFYSGHWNDQFQGANKAWVERWRGRLIGLRWRRFFDGLCRGRLSNYRRRWRGCRSGRIL